MKTAAPFEFYIDFDNTITEIDILDDIIQRFSINDDWKRVEEAWEAGEIGSRECLERQFAQVRVSGPAFQDYLRTIRIDPAFAPIIALVRDKGIEPVILSDSFTMIITKVLEHHGVTGIRTISNEMQLEGDRPRVSFPHFHAICTKCGNCKTSHLIQRNRPAGTRKIYVGDGQSDICPAGFCEILFAKGRLFKHYSPLRKDCIPFQHLGTVHAELQRLLK